MPKYIRRKFARGQGIKETTIIVAKNKGKATALRNMAHAQGIRMAPKTAKYLVNIMSHNGISMLKSDYVPQLFASAKLLQVKKSNEAGQQIRPTVTRRVALAATSLMRKTTASTNTRNSLIYNEEGRYTRRAAKHGYPGRRVTNFYNPLKMRDINRFPKVGARTWAPIRRPVTAEKRATYKKNPYIEARKAAKQQRLAGGRVQVAQKPSQLQPPSPLIPGKAVVQRGALLPAEAESMRQIGRRIAKRVGKQKKPQVTINPFAEFITPKMLAQQKAAAVKKKSRAMELTRYNPPQ